MSTLDLALVPFLNPNGTISQAWYLYLFGQNSATNSNTVSLATVNAALTAATDELRSLPTDQSLPTIAALDTRVQALESAPVVQPDEVGMKINSIQRGVITWPGTNATTQTATITAVDTTKSELRWLGTETGNADLEDGFIYLQLTNSTTITATKKAVGGSTASVSWELTEWK